MLSIRSSHDHGWSSNLRLMHAKSAPSCDSSTPEACASRRTSNVFTALPRQVSVHRVTMCSLRHKCTRTGSKPSGCGSAPLSCVTSAPSVHNQSLRWWPLCSAAISHSQKLRPGRSLLEDTCRAGTGTIRPAIISRDPGYPMPTKRPSLSRFTVAVADDVLHVNLFLTRHGHFCRCQPCCRQPHRSSQTRLFTPRCPVTISGACVPRS